MKSRASRTLWGQTRGLWSWSLGSLRRQSGQRPGGRTGQRVGSLPAGSPHEDIAPPCPFDSLAAVSFQKLQEESIFFIVFEHRLCLALGTCPRGQIPQPLLDAGRTCHVFTSMSAKAGCGKQAGRPEARASAHSLPSPRTLPGPRPAEQEPPTGRSSDAPCGLGLSQRPELPMMAVGVQLTPDQSSRTKCKQQGGVAGMGRGSL